MNEHLSKHAHLHEQCTVTAMTLAAHYKHKSRERTRPNPITSEQTLPQNKLELTYTEIRPLNSCAVKIVLACML